MEGRIWLINHNGSAALYTLIHPPRVSADGLDPIFYLPLLCDGVPINSTFFSLRWVLEWSV